MCYILEIKSSAAFDLFFKSLQKCSRPAIKVMKVHQVVLIAKKFSSTAARLDVMAVVEKSISARKLPLILGYEFNSIVQFISM
jgi:hypothetical protein